METTTGEGAIDDRYEVERSEVQRSSALHNLRDVYLGTSNEELGVDRLDEGEPSSAMNGL